ncbi:pantetheine-phosphate adenylyltransferase [Aureispira anguillae]|uniref:Phosphopantetheine adenylyltransferase n=1 Tax=Aureispira anguillae TaxID=2864201 RepID=A0A916DR02_9BACT|nr:pantetheine-phosphate adenylyltransferase [Aureispira anguillae]BDS10375.1 pantetheine-phosphate adenylyltransferase [Aureispira anguillae]
MRIAVFAGSFDPVTKGHVDIVKRAIPLFDKIIVAMGINSAKRYFFETEQRIAFLEAAYEQEPKVEIDTYEQLTAFYCKEKGANFLLRGLRNSTDFNYENTIANLNSTIGENLETVFLMADPQYSCYSSTVVREIIKGGGDASIFLPARVVALLEQ